MRMIEAVVVLVFWAAIITAIMIVVGRGVRNARRARRARAEAAAPWHKVEYTEHGTRYVWCKHHGEDSVYVGHARCADVDFQDQMIGLRVEAEDKLRTLNDE